MDNKEVVYYIKAVMSKLFTKHNTDRQKFDDYCQDAFIKYLEDKDNDDFKLCLCVKWSFTRNIQKDSRYSRFKQELFFSNSNSTFLDIISRANQLNPASKDYPVTHNDLRPTSQGYPLISNYCIAANPEIMFQTTYVDSLLGHLSPLQSQRFQARMEGLTFEEITKVEDINVTRQAVYQSVKKAVNKLTPLVRHE